MKFKLTESLLVSIQTYCCSVLFRNNEPPECKMHHLLVHNMYCEDSVIIIYKCATALLQKVMTPVYYSNRHPSFLSESFDL